MAVDAILPIRGFQQGGLVMDSDPFSLSFTEWSDAKNVRFHDRVVSKITGEETIKTLTGGGDPVTLTYWRQPTIIRYVYQTDTGRTFLANATGNDVEITKGFSATAEPLATGVQYTGGLFNGGASYIVNDSVNEPQYINATGSGTNTQELVDIPNWNYGDAFTTVQANVLRPYRNVLVAGDFTFTRTNGNVVYGPSTLRVSGVVAQGNLPTWDPAANAITTEDEQELSTNDPIIDMAPLQDILVIYCQNSIHFLRLNYAEGGLHTYGQLLQGRGLLSANCVAEYYGRHFVVGNDDIYLYGGGASVESLADERVREYFFSNLNGMAKDATFLFHNQSFDEMWICYPKGTATTATEALIYNYRHNTWARRDLTNTVAAQFGALPDDFDNPTAFAEGALGGVIISGSELRAVDRGTSFAGQAIDSYVERKGLDVDPNNDMQNHKIRSAWIVATGEGSLDTAVRAVEAPGRPVDLTLDTDRYVKQRVYELSGDMSDYKVDPRSEGRFFNIRIGSNDTTSSWSLVSYQLGIDATFMR